jgi:hypothetical protein
MERKKESHQGQGVPYKELLFVALTTLAAGTYGPTDPPFSSLLGGTVLFYCIRSYVGFGYSFFLPSQLIYNTTVFIFLIPLGGPRF